MTQHLTSLQLNEMYVFYVRDPDDDRADRAFVGKYLGPAAGGFIQVEAHSLCPHEDATQTKHLRKDSGYVAYPLPNAEDDVWGLLPALLVPPAGWPQVVQTAKGLDKDAPPIQIAKVNPKGEGLTGVAWVEIDLARPRVAKPFVLELARLLLQSFRWKLPT